MPRCLLTRTSPPVPVVDPHPVREFDTRAEVFEEQAPVSDALASGLPSSGDMLGSDTVSPGPLRRSERSRSMPSHLQDYYI